MKLLSGKPISEFSPEEYRAYVRSQYKKFERKKSVAKKKPLRPFIAKRTKTGKLQLKVNRTPKTLTALEMNEISLATQIPLNEIFLKMKKLGVRCE